MARERRTGGPKLPKELQTPPNARVGDVVGGFDALPWRFQAFVRSLLDAKRIEPTDAAVLVQLGILGVRNRSPIGNVPSPDIEVSAKALGRSMARPMAEATVRASGARLVRSGLLSLTPGAGKRGASVWDVSRVWELSEAAAREESAVTKRFRPGPKGAARKRSERDARAALRKRQRAFLEREGSNEPSARKTSKRGAKAAPHEERAPLTAEFLALRARLEHLRASPDTPEAARRAAFDALKADPRAQPEVCRARALRAFELDEQHRRTAEHGNAGIAGATIAPDLARASMLSELSDRIDLDDAEAADELERLEAALTESPDPLAPNAAAWTVLRSLAPRLGLTAPDVVHLARARLASVQAQGNGKGTH